LSLLVSFFLALVTALFGSALLPNVRLMAFAPFLALLYMRKSFVTSLWIACLSGLLIDLLASQHRFGIYGLGYGLITVLLYSQRKHFFDDKPLGLALFTALISFVSSTLQLLAFERSISLTWKLACTDLIGMPLVDAVYAFVWFTCPIKVYQHLTAKKPQKETS
jgi:rod shape-determining protein MreD